MSVSLAADYFSISAVSLRSLPVETIRIGRRVLYDRRALDQYADRLSGLPDYDTMAVASLSPQKQHDLACAEVERRFFANRKRCDR